MFQELSLLLEAAPAEASRDDYAHLVIDDNCLGKRTTATRKLSLQRLRELYGLNRQILLFRVLRDMWENHGSSRPLLALLLAVARDPLLRATASVVIRSPYGLEVPRQSVTDVVSKAAADRLGPADDGQSRAQRSVFVDPIRTPARQVAARSDSVCMRRPPPPRTRCCSGMARAGAADSCSRPPGAQSSTPVRRSSWNRPLQRGGWGCSTSSSRGR